MKKIEFINCPKCGQQHRWGDFCPQPNNRKLKRPPWIVRFWFTTSNTHRSNGQILFLCYLITLPVFLCSMFVPLADLAEEGGSYYYSMTTIDLVWYVGVVGSLFGIFMQSMFALFGFIIWKWGGMRHGGTSYYRIPERLAKKHNWIREQ